MPSRDRNLTILLFGLILLGVGGVAGYMFVYEPIQQKRTAALKLGKEVADLDAKLLKAKADAPRLAVARRRSLPADVALGRREYQHALSRLGSAVGPGVEVKEKQNPDTAGIPLLAPKKLAYTRVVYDVSFKSADMWAVHDFLKGYYQLNLLHQITALSIKADASQRGRQATDRRDLTVRLTSEAIVLDGAEVRHTLLPVSPLFAAVGGLAGAQAIAQSPETGRLLAPLQLVPVLAATPRDYSLIVQNDLFHGPIPKAPTRPRWRKRRPDISDSIKLVLATTRSDGTATAVVRDHFNPHTYEIEVARDGVKVMKYWYPSAVKKPELEYRRSPKPTLIIGDELSSTERTFRVVAIDGEGMIVADLKAGGEKGTSKPTDKASAGASGPAGALALAIGTAAAVAGPTASDQLPLYRWPVGKSLKQLTAVPKDEARKILQKVAETGPVGATTVAAGN